MQKIDQKYIYSVVKKALLEDLLPNGDLTKNLVVKKNKIINQSENRFENLKMVSGGIKKAP